ncbi:unnamed protein product [Ilex paraguariensis]|uniref:Late embryogenesis abundant protein LEA-2 subgroup domain-containing protein n=1 Tax=Ilex paraguariensis TaxID=185542 RepID=A0ABC8TTM5_9AQUA
MMHAKSDSDATSLTPSSSPTSPKRPIPVYYVQSPSRDSHDDADKSSSSMHATPTYTSPMESPSHSSTSLRHSRASSASRVSGNLRSNRKRNDKGWPECNVIEEEGDYDDFYGDSGFTRRCQCLIAIMVFGCLFSVFCLIIWGASRPYRARVSVKSLTVNNFYLGGGSDLTGVPTRLLTVNCSVKVVVYNPATFFGIYVTANPVSLMYSELTVATGQLKKHYQPRKSERTVFVNVEGYMVPLYGAGASLAAPDGGVGVPLKLEFEMQSRGNLVGKLVKTKHRRHISCSLVINSKNTKAIEFKENSCTYEV